MLTTKEKPVDRADDPDLAEKMKAEAEGIFLWALEGLQRLVANNFKFTESDRIRENREAVKRDNNNIFDFMESEGYIRCKADASISSKDFYEIYRMWCEENSLFRQVFSCEMLCFPRCLNVCTESFKTRAIFDFCHIASPTYILYFIDCSWNAAICVRIKLYNSHFPPCIVKWAIL